MNKVKVTDEEMELKYECGDGYIWMVADWDQNYVWMYRVDGDDDIQTSNEEFQEMEVNEGSV